MSDILTRAREVLPFVSAGTGAIIEELIEEVRILRGQPFTSGQYVKIRPEYEEWYIRTWPGIDPSREMQILDCKGIVVYAVQDRIAFRFFADWLIKVDKLAEIKGVEK